ncbi:tyrosine-type recombinase/integrase [Nocardia sp. NPDC087230]|uniref:tyrosine-type recombinase/integrase n=1 Tax=Nocardia sp. NPDC087230 TaxID=3364331 RepID=UPI00380CF41A
MLCESHHYAWRWFCSRNVGADFEAWVAERNPQRGFGECLCRVCTYTAVSSLGLCELHRQRYYKAGRPGGAYGNQAWTREETRPAAAQPVVADEAAYARWCVEQEPVYRFGVLNLRGLPPLVQAEFQYGLHTHALNPRRAMWEFSALQRLATMAREAGHSSLTLFDTTPRPRTGQPRMSTRVRIIAGEISQALRLIYTSPAETKEAGYIETDHFGRRFRYAVSTFDLTTVPQRWLRDLLWDYMAETLQSANCPTSRAVFDQLRRACNELGAFLHQRAPGGGHTPSLLHAHHAVEFVTDQRHRERHGLASLADFRSDRQPHQVTAATRRACFNHVRRVLYWAFETGRTAQLGLAQGFVTAIPNGGNDATQSRNPFSDSVAQALSAEHNLERLAAHDPKDQGLRDFWEIVMATGRRCREVTELRLDCVGVYGGMPLLWHDQTKVGNLNAGIRIPQSLHDRILTRQSKTVATFEHRFARLPTPDERAGLALFPSPVGNPDQTRSISYAVFSRRFQQWVAELDLGPAVPHQARHTLATNLMRAGASLAHIRRYLGHISDRMAQHYVSITNADLEDALHTVWVAGPGAAEPGLLLTSADARLTREQALALALDLSRRSTPTDGGFCTFQPVVSGGTCPWQLDCHNCDKFVLSGADLLYWRRKQEQWRSIAERAPDDATAEYLHQVFEPTARAIAGLEKALAGLGLLNEALSLDLRRPQNYFHRVWSTNFLAHDLAGLEQGPA